MDAVGRIKEIISSSIRAVTGRSSASVSQASSSSDRHEKTTPEGQRESPRCEESFLKRLKTFTVFTWAGKPSTLSPPVCARLGWTCVQRDRLRCVSCKAELPAALPSTKCLEYYNKIVGEVQQALVERHAKHCYWRVTPSPEFFGHIPWRTDDQVNTQLKARAFALVTQLGDGLPLLDTSDSTLQEALPSLHTFAKETCPSGIDLWRMRCAVVLAGAGWQIGSLKGGKRWISCEECNRSLGLWNYAIGSDSDEANADSEAETEESHKREKTKALNPVGDHCTWCPWVNPASNRGNTAGIRFVADAISGNCETESLQSDEKIKTSPAHGIWSIRRVSDHWSSPPRKRRSLRQAEAGSSSSSHSPGTSREGHGPAPADGSQSPSPLPRKAFVKTLL